MKQAAAPRRRSAAYNRVAMANPSRRDALVTIAAAGLSGAPLAAQRADAPRALAAEDYELLGALLDLVIPPSETPGARQAGAPAIIDETLAGRPDERAAFEAGLRRLRAAGFAEMTPAEQNAALREYEQSSGETKAFFESLKALTVDAYYSTEIGLVEELGYKGNTYLAEFPGCAHEHSLEDRGGGEAA